MTFLEILEKTLLQDERFIAEPGFIFNNIYFEWHPLYFSFVPHKHRCVAACSRILYRAIYFA
jgi:hypothetical protein